MLRAEIRVSRISIGAHQSFESKFYDAWVSWYPTIETYAIACKGDDSSVIGRVIILIDHL